MKQTQFLEVVDRDVAERRFRGALDLSPLGEEQVPLSACLGRVYVFSRAITNAARARIPGRSDPHGPATDGFANTRPLTLIPTSDVGPKSRPTR